MRLFFKEARVRQRKEHESPEPISLKNAQSAKQKKILKLNSEDWYRRAAAAVSIRRESPSIVPDQSIDK